MARILFCHKCPHLTTEKQFYVIESAPFCALTIRLDNYRVEKCQSFYMHKEEKPDLDMEKVSISIFYAAMLNGGSEYMALLGFQKRLTAETFCE